MKKILFFYIIFFFAVSGLVTYYGCSEIDKTAIVAPTAGVHPAGWKTPGNANFHGTFIRANNKWNLSECRSCHGNDYAGGVTGVSCNTCHTDQGGPESCTNCHGNSGSKDTLQNHIFPPFSLNGDSLETDRGVGVHYHHLTSDPNERYSAQVRCVDCHQPVNNFRDASHFQNSNGMATLHFDSLAINTLPGDTTMPHPVYDPVSNKCSNVYCHGNFKNGNRDFQPTFNDPKSVVCGSCHGDPKSGNPTPGAPDNFVPPHYSFYTINTCYQCHSSVIDNTGTIIAPEKHINGVVNVYP
jgi:predicted CxxxxCH...CXXCH cytochrome family protein